jgi:hypothetical protein
MAYTTIDDPSAYFQTALSIQVMQALILVQLMTGNVRFTDQILFGVNVEVQLKHITCMTLQEEQKKDFHVIPLQ